MSWEHHRRRRAAIKSVLEYAEKHPQQGLPYEHVAQARENFAQRRDLVLALQYDWSQALWAKIELLSLDPKGSHALADAATLARQAWLETAARHPVLRRLLDGCQDEIGVHRERERQFLISAGLGHTSHDRATHVA